MSNIKDFINFGGTVSGITSNSQTEAINIDESGNTNIKGDLIVDGDFSYFGVDLRNTRQM